MARWKPHMGQGMGGGVWCLLFACCSPGTPLSSPTGKLSEPHCEGVFMEVPSGWHNWLNPWPLMTKLNLQSLSRPLGWEDRGWGRKFQTSNHRLAPSSNQPPSSKSHWVSIPETTLHHFKGLRGSCGRNQGLRVNILTKDAPVTLVTQEITSFRSSVSRTRERPNIHSLSCHSTPNHYFWELAVYSEKSCIKPNRLNRRSLIVSGRIKTTLIVYIF